MKKEEGNVSQLGDEESREREKRQDKHEREGIKKGKKLSGAELKQNYKERVSMMWQVFEKPKNFLSASAFSLYYR